MHRIALALLALLALMAAPAAAAPSAALRALCEEYWRGHLETYPVMASALGVPGHDHRLEDPRPAARRREEKRLRGVLERARAIAERTLDPQDRLTRGALIEEVEGQLATLGLGFEEWVVDAQNGPQTALNNLPDVITIRTTADGANYVRRLREIPRHMDHHLANLERGVKRNKAATRDAVRRTLATLDALLARPAAEWPMARPAREERPEWAPADREAFARDVVAAVETGVIPAFRRFRDFLADRVMPVARPPERPGLMHLPAGRDAYARCIRVHTSLDREAQAIHELGQAEVARIRKDLALLGSRVLGTSDVPEIQRRLRGDTAMHFRTAEEIEAKARATLARAQAAIPQWFGILPKAPCDVRVMGEHEAPNSYVAYYRQPAPDGSRPGVYMINTYRPTTRTRYEAEALAFHESIPGHHLQIAIAQELEGLPEFRKHQGVTAFVEGWALYTERLADEMNLYSGDLDRIGMLSYDAWRACRLVVDTGLHALGWTRAQAIEYMRGNTVLAENNIENEVDRYINWPGQALAYKIGQLEILELRAEARRRLGDRFDIREFHDVVLRNGAVALPVLAAEVRAWAGGRAAAR